MPQLDRIIVFSQIFWLLLIFTSLYTILLHFFLPLFLKSLKSRKQILEVNALEVETIESNSVEKQISLRKVLTKSLSSVKNVLKNDFLFLSLSKEKLNEHSSDAALGRILCNTTMYCDNQLLNFISLSTKPLNLKFQS